MYSLLTISGVYAADWTTYTIDLAVLVEACKFTRKLAHISPFKDIIGEFYFTELSFRR